MNSFKFLAMQRTFFYQEMQTENLIQNFSNRIKKVFRYIMNLVHLYGNNIFCIFDKTMNKESQDIDIDSIIQKLLENKTKEFPLKESQLRCLCVKSREIFISQPMFLELEAPIKIAGDIHGQYSDLLRIFEFNGYPGDVNYLFLGDYVDRGKKQIQTISLLLAYKIKHPENFFLLRGNHESASINRIYGFYEQCKRKYNLKLWKLFCDVFNTMPVAATIDQKILCMHGGLSPDLHKFEQISQIDRPIEVPDQGLLCDLLWSDPDSTMKGWGQNYERGISFIYGYDVIESFLKKHDLDLICRAHQVVEDGYEFFCHKKLVTIFSAPDYCGEFENNGATMNVDEDLMCSFQIIKSKKDRKPKNSKK